jgi:hypothetical protein
MSHGGKQSKKNRKDARNTLKDPDNPKKGTFKGTKEAREAGVYLPTADQRKKNREQRLKVDLESTRPKPDLQKQADRAIEQEKKKKG